MAKTVQTKVIEWCKEYADNDTYGYKKWTEEVQSHQCPLCHSDTEKGWSAIGFVTAAYYHGGGITSLICYNMGLGKTTDFEGSTASAVVSGFKSRNGNKVWKGIVNGDTGRTINKIDALKISDLKKGDIIVFYDKNNYKSIAIYESSAGNGKINIYDCLANTGISYRTRKISNDTSIAKIAFRYTGVETATTDDEGNTTSEKSTSSTTYAKPTCTQDVIDGAVSWAIKIAKDNRFHYGYGTAAHSNGCYFCGTQPAKKKNAGIKNYKFTYCCNPYVHAAWAHGGGDPLALKKCKSGGSWDFHAGKGYDTCSHFTKIKAKSESDLKAGDVLCRDTHVVLYIGNGKIAEATTKDDNVINSSGWNASIHTRKLSTKYGGQGLSAFPRVYRYTYDGSFKNFGKAYKGGDTAGNISSSEAILDNSAGIAKLYSSANYHYLDEDSDPTRTASSDFKNMLAVMLNNLSEQATSSNEKTISDEIVLTGLPKLSEDEINTKKAKQAYESAPSSSLFNFQNYVEAPIAIIDFDGIKIGGVGNSGDDYPNYLTSVAANKINGQINTYKIQLTYQVRPGEDPNFIDTLLSRVGYTTPISILYGDANATSLYKESSAIITNATYSEDVSACRITYTLDAISSAYVTGSSYFNFTQQNCKPSTAIYDLLYNSGEASQYLQSVFPGMKNRTLVSSRGLIPTSDATVQIGAAEKKDPVSYLQYLVACMTSESNVNSTYFLSYCDDSEDFDGAYFRITEVTSYNSEDITSGISINAPFYEVDVGYPTNNYILGFELSNNDYWGQVYEYNDIIPTYSYSIDGNGNILLDTYNGVTSDNKFLDNSLIYSNWWKNVTEFPISAKLTMRGLIKTTMLTSYIRVNAQFFGQRDIGSGIYVVTAQNDIVQSSGCVTELTLLRVAGDNVKLNYKG